MSTTSRPTRHSNGGGYSNKQPDSLAKYRGACPAGRTDAELIDLVKRMNGDDEKIQSALEDWWQHDQGEWVTSTKKKRAGKAGMGGGGGGYSNGRGHDDRRDGRGSLGDKMRGVRIEDRDRRSYHDGGGYRGSGGGRGRGRSAPPAGGRGGGGGRGSGGASSGGWGGSRDSSGGGGGGAWGNSRSTSIPPQ
ncbi:unnamed protein product, partial [Choristocarpus tenellus]